MVLALLVLTLALMFGVAFLGWLLWTTVLPLAVALQRSSEGSLEALARDNGLVYCPIRRELAHDLSEQLSQPVQIRFVPRGEHPLLWDMQVETLPQPARTPVDLEI